MKGSRAAVVVVILTAGFIVGLVWRAQAQQLQLVSSPPRFGTFFTVQQTNFPPLPFGPFPDLPVFSLGPNTFLVDDSSVDYSALSAAQAMNRGLMGEMDVSNDNSSTFAAPDYGTNVWLEITNVSGGQVSALLHNGTDQVYAIWSTTNLLTCWSVETEVWPTDTNSMPFTVLTQNRQNLFLRAEDWTGVTENGNTIPDWWLWEYFGTTALSDTNLDSQGNTLLYDYQNGLDPNVINFSIQVTNQFVSTSFPPVQLNVSGGLPSSIAVLVDSTNYAGATWTP